MKTDEKKILATVRQLLKDELKERSNAKHIRGFNSKLVPADRNVRETRDGTPKPLKFGGNPYVIIWTDQMYGVAGDDSSIFFSRAFRYEAWKNVVATNFPDNRLAIDGIDHLLLDPEFDVNGRILFGFTGLKVQSFQPLPQVA